MNNEENKIVENQENTYVDPRNIQAEVIGELKNDKVGKPVFILIFSGLLVVLMIALPFINTYINDESGFIYQFLHPESTNTNSNKPNIAKGYGDGSKLQILSSTNKFKFDNIVLSKCYIETKSIKCMINSYNGLIDLDNDNYALEVYSNSQKLMGSFRLYGSYDYTEKEIELVNEDIKFNTNLSYYGKIVKVTEESMPDIQLNVNELGEQVLVCSKENENIIYKFKDNLLISFEESVSYTKGENEQEYLTLLDNYRVKGNNLPNNVILTEYPESFVYTLKVDLNNDMIPEDYKTDNYYNLNETGKKIHYGQSGKGFDCR